jgi:hypothetical protein
VAVPIYDSGKSGRFGLEVQLLQIVQNLNRNAADFQNIGLWKLLCQCSCIDVPAYRHDRRNLGQTIEDHCVTHITRVNNPI